MELIDPVEALRASFRPQEITTLFVGESAPHGGKTFFYDGDNDMVRYMERATEAALGCSGDFLGRFKAAGWYLDDLVLRPVNKMLKPERMRLCRGAQGSLRDRLAAYRPRAIVSLLVSIRPIVEVQQPMPVAKPVYSAFRSRAWVSKGAFMTRWRGLLCFCRGMG